MALFVGDIGKKIILTVGVDISAATTRRIIYRKPNGKTGYFTASQETTTSISYTTTAVTDIDEAGGWQFQAYVVTSTWTQYGTIVREDIEAPIASM